MCRQDFLRPNILCLLYTLYQILPDIIGLLLYTLCQILSLRIVYFMSTLCIIHMGCGEIKFIHLFNKNIHNSKTYIYLIKYIHTNYH